jgi:hypothetical protein
MKTLFYKKVGRNYEPVAEYDNEWMDSFPKGSHLVTCQPGVTSRRFNIDPAFAPMIAAGIYGEDAVSKAIMKATEMRPSSVKWTDKELSAFQDFLKVLGDDQRFMVSYSSARDAAEAGVKAMQQEADKFLKHESVRKSYEHFLLMCQLVKEQERD